MRLKPMAIFFLMAALDVLVALPLGLYLLMGGLQSIGSAGSWAAIVAGCSIPLGAIVLSAVTLDRWDGRIGVPRGRAFRR